MSDTHSPTQPGAGAFSAADIKRRMAEREAAKEMSSRKALLGMAVALALAMPAAAQAPGPGAALDGKYAGVSAEVTKHTSHHGPCPRGHTPDTLTVANGAVHSSGRDSWSGTVGPQGGVILRNKRAMRVNAQIGPDGSIRGEYAGPACSVAYVWQKQSG